LVHLILENEKKCRSNPNSKEREKKKKGSMGLLTASEKKGPSWELLGSLGNPGYPGKAIDIETENSGHVIKESKG
jgi:hypothetical protein